VNKRSQETQRCLILPRDALDDAWTVRAKPLFRDREKLAVAALPAR
jgi:hypothetical protein